MLPFKCAASLLKTSLRNWNIIVRLYLWCLNISCYTPFLQEVANISDIFECLVDAYQVVLRQLVGMGLVCHLTNATYFWMAISIFLVSELLVP